MLHLVKLLRWAIELAAVILRTPLINFEVNIADAVFAAKVAAVIKDGKLTDEELADFLDLVAQALLPKAKAD